MLDTATGCAITTHSTFCSHGGSGVEPMYRQYAPSETPSCNACKGPGVRVWVGTGLILLDSLELVGQLDYECTHRPLGKKVVDGVDAAIPDVSQVVVLLVKVAPKEV